jgi:hypothetical protein
MLATYVFPCASATGRAGQGRALFCGQGYLVLHVQLGGFDSVNLVMYIYVFLSFDIDRTATTCQGTSVCGVR